MSNGFKNLPVIVQTSNGVVSTGATTINSVSTWADGSGATLNTTALLYASNKLSQAGSLTVCGSSELILVGAGSPQISIDGSQVVVFGSSLVSDSDGNLIIGESADKRPAEIYTTAAAWTGAAFGLGSGLGAGLVNGNNSVAPNFTGLAGAAFNNNTSICTTLAMNKNPDNVDVLHYMDAISYCAPLVYRQGLANSGYIAELRLSPTSPVYGGPGVLSGAAPTSMNLSWDKDGSGDLGRSLTFPSLVIGDITYYAVLPGPDRNGYTIAYANDSTSGQESVTVVGSALTVHIQSGITTADTIAGLIAGYPNPAYFVVALVTGTGSNAQTTHSAAPLAGGSFTGYLRPAVIAAKSGIGVGQSAAQAASAIFEAVSTSKGLLPPRMTTTQKNGISSPAEGLVVYDLTLHALCVYNGTSWKTVTVS